MCKFSKFLEICMREKDVNQQVATIFQQNLHLLAVINQRKKIPDIICIIVPFAENFDGSGY